MLEEIDRPPNLQTGNVVMAVRIGGPAGGAMDPATMTPEQKADNSAAIKVETIEQPAQANPVSNAIEQMVHPVPEKPNPRQFPASSVCGQLDMNRPAQAFCNPNPIWIDPDSSVQNAIQLMQQHNTGYLLAGKEGKLEGILSRSDIAAAVSPYTKSMFSNYRRSLDDASFQLRCRWFLSRPARAIPSDTPLWAAIDTMCKYAIRSLVILDAQQRGTDCLPHSIFYEISSQPMNLFWPARSARHPPSRLSLK